MSAPYPPPCSGCGDKMQPMATNGPGSFVAIVCEHCDGDTLETMWGEFAEPCQHEWLDRPESDSRECLMCGSEAFG